MSNQSPLALPPLIDDERAPEAFADEAVGFLIHNGNVTITFAASRSDYASDNPNVRRVVMARIVMPIGGAQDLALGLYDFLKSSGHDPAPKNADESIQ